MESGDGLLLRVRPRGAALTGRSLNVIADVSARFGNGRIDLTRRANLQIRGVRHETLDAAQDALAEAGLLDADAGVEAVRNVMLSPLAGLDPDSSPEAGAIGAAIEHALSSDPVYRSLPPKFSFLVDGGGRLPLGDISADIRVELGDGLARLSVGGGGAAATPLALVPSERAANVALALAEAFLALSQDLQHRSMRALLTAVGRDAIALAAKLPKPLGTRRAKRQASARRPVLFGPQPGYFGLGAAFGGFEARQIAALAGLASDGVRLTPWRALLVPSPPATLASEASALGLVTRADDPRLSVAACPGHPACLSGEIATRPAAEMLALALALALAFDRREGIALHVSGCAKGCAHGDAAPFTLVGHEGRFDLVLDGRARDPAVLSGLNAAQAESAIALASRRALAS